MIAVGMPSPHGDQQDEDGLDREHSDGGENDNDIASDAIVAMVNHLKDSKASAVRDIRAFTAALEDLCQAFMDKDYHAVGDAADAARDALHNLISG
jgi:hypothetical protein